MSAIGKAALGLTLSLGAFGCIPAYEPPRMEQPHAVIKLRRSYETVAGVRLSEQVLVDRHLALSENEIAQVAKTALTDAFLAHPIPSNFEVSSNFFHYEMRTVQESYQEPRTEYRMESYSCGFGTSPRTCTRSVSHTTYTTRYRMVTKQVEVSDGSCEQTLRFSPQNGRSYLLQYTYQASGVCSLSCFEQVPRGAGEFENRGCPPAPPES